MSVQRKISLLLQRRQTIRQWLDDEAPFTRADQRHLEPDTPERAYWHHGYQAALTDVINLLAVKARKPGIADKASGNRPGDPDEPDSRAD
jgi:hypothetical protein